MPPFVPCVDVRRRDAVLAVLHGHQVAGKVDHLAAVVNVKVVEASFLRSSIAGNIASLDQVCYKSSRRRF